MMGYVPIVVHTSAFALQLPWNEISSIWVCRLSEKSGSVLHTAKSEMFPRFVADGIIEKDNSILVVRFALFIISELEQLC